MEDDLRHTPALHMLEIHKIAHMRSYHDAVRLRLVGWRLVVYSS